MKQWLLTGLMLVASSAAVADTMVDGRVAAGIQTLESDSGDLDIDSLGVDARGHFDIDENLFLRSSVLIARGKAKAGPSKDDSELHIFRFGLGYQSALPKAIAYGALEFDRHWLKVGKQVTEHAGLVGSVGARDPGTSPFLWQAELGLLSVGSVGGVVDVQAGYRITPSMAVLAGLQSYFLSEDQQSITSGTVGLRFDFKAPETR